jgi:hypothetical protein
MTRRAERRDLFKSAAQGDDYLSHNCELSHDLSHLDNWGGTAYVLSLAFSEEPGFSYDFG